MLAARSPQLVLSSHPRLEADTGGGRGGIKKQRRLSRLEAEAGLLRPCVHHLLCRHACTVLRHCVQVMLSCLCFRGEKWRSATMWDLRTMLALRWCRKCARLNTVLLFSICHYVKQKSTPREPIMCHHLWLLHPQPKVFRIQTGSMHVHVFHHCKG